MDNGRIGKGATMYYPVAVQGALLSAGDPHASQGEFGAVRHGYRGGNFGFNAALHSK